MQIQPIPLLSNSSTKNTIQKHVYQWPPFLKQNNSILHAQIFKNQTLHLSPVQMVAVFGNDQKFFSNKNFRTLKAPLSNTLNYAWWVVLPYFKYLFLVILVNNIFTLWYYLSGSTWRRSKYIFHKWAFDTFWSDQLTWTCSKAGLPFNTSYTGVLCISYSISCSVYLNYIFLHYIRWISMKFSIYPCPSKDESY